MIKHLGREDAPHELIELEPGEQVLSAIECKLLWNLLKDHWIMRDGDYETAKNLLNRLSEFDS